jgi:hypothetical protein
MTRPNAEEIVDQGLREAGYRTYLPRYRRRMLGHRWSTGAAIRPRFEGYLFVQDWSGWPQRPITGVFGLMKVAASDRPAYLDMHDVTEIMHAERVGRFDDCPPFAAKRHKRSDLAEGDAVTFELAGQRVVGAIENLSSNGDALVRAMILNREVAFTLQQETLDLVAP